MRIARRLALAVGLLSGCATTSADIDGGGNQVDPLPGEGAIVLGRGETLPAFTPQATAAQNYAMGERAMEAKLYVLAQRFFYFIRRKFPYSRFAVLADLRIADCLFERDRWIESIDAYQTFVRLHPTHAQVPFAMFRAGKANFELVPTDWFFLPPSHEKDQKSVRDTATALAAYVDRFPEHENAEEGQKLLRKVRQRLVAHERYAADFYKRLGKLRGYAGRLERMKTRFGGFGRDASLLQEMVDVYVELGEAEKAKELVAELEKDFPDARDELGRARKALEKLPAPTAAAPEVPASSEESADES